MRSEDYVRSDYADLWLSDHYLRCGLENILQQMTFENKAMRYVFLTEDKYLDVLEHQYDLTKNKIILLTDGSRFHFLDGLSFYQFPTKSGIAELQKFMTSMIHSNETQAKPKSPVLLTRRERLLIDLIKEGKRMAEMGGHLNLHVKTVYQIRQTLIKKMGCSGAVDLMRTLHSDVFKSWLTQNHHYH